METPNYRKGSIIFDDDTILQVEQRGGGGSGVGGETGLAAVNLKTGESTNAALAAKDETIAEQAETIEEQAATIETQAATIIELQEELAEVPTIEALSVTANGTYSESGKAYSPVNVNVSALPGYLTLPVRANIINQTNTDIKVFRPYLRNYELQAIYEKVIATGSSEFLDIPILTTPTGTYANIQIALSEAINATVTTPAAGLDIATATNTRYIKFNVHKTDYQGARLGVTLT